MGKINLGAQLAEARVKKGPPCTMSLVLAELDGDDRVALQNALDDEAIAHTTIYRVLTSNGFRVSLHTVTRHRRGECLCAAQ